MFGSKAVGPDVDVVLSASEREVVVASLKSYEAVMSRRIASELNSAIREILEADLEAIKALRGRL